MDLHKVFESISIQLIAEFTKSTQVKHHGGKGDIREDAFRDFLAEYLPRKYGTGRGEVISSQNDVSGELDIVIFDNDHCPLFIKSSSHSVYPAESVYGAISMKSNLDSTELQDAYENIVKFKRMLPKTGFTHNPNSGMSLGMGPAVPVTAVIAYGSNRSMEAIAKQLKELDSQIDDITLRPDFVAVIGMGLIGPRGKLRGEFNKYTLPENVEDLCSLRKTGRHTLLRLYMQFLDELNSIQLKSLNLQEYFDMPHIEGVHKVRRHDKLMLTPIDGGETEVKKLTAKAIEKIVESSKPVPLREHFVNAYGQVPQGAEQHYDLDLTIYEFNPHNKKSILSGGITRNKQGHPIGDGSTYQPIPIEIDNKNYAVDFGSLESSDFVENQDYTVDELMSI
ncbi:hypothetical protein L2725_08570 [Shewanella corallii]|uniref:DUF6602 domain-containing protein n=1 Tax=Shewanella corallii TaxID=560080 RepID=A0ABT0N625_9GAMM|nr:DUF6602 domain-containing protein [Shewanella corallii]MCL2913845.1 hypothetical protein [Shewanella corallii]